MATSATLQTETNPIEGNISKTPTEHVQKDPENTIDSGENTSDLKNITSTLREYVVQKMDRYNWLKGEISVLKSRIDHYQEVINVNMNYSQSTADTFTKLIASYTPELQGYEAELQSFETRIIPVLREVCEKLENKINSPNDLYAAHNKLNQLNLDKYVQDVPPPSNSNSTSTETETETETDTDTDTDTDEDD
uniref:Uncharacterized protein n=1 Tax=viral metagenome TaxID=1070528 RepID=A0A6C0E773_9ZZZZ